MKKNSSLLILCVLLTGCGGGGSTVGGGTQAVLTSPISTVRTYRTLQFTLSSQNTVKRGATLPITMTVKNIGTAAVPVTLPGLQGIALVSTGGTTGTEVWRSDYGLAQSAIIFNTSLAPNESHSYTFNWNTTDDMGKPVGNGSYIVTASYNAIHVDGVSVNPVSDLSTAPITVSVTDGN